MKKYLTGVTFRLDFFSLPDFKAKYIPKIKQKFPQSRFQERSLTENERQIVDIDSLASSLDLLIIDIKEEKTYIFENIIIADVPYTIYVSSNFICIHSDVDCCSYPEFPGQVINSIVGDVFDNIDLQNIFCMTTHSYATSKEEDVWQVINQDAYPKLDLTNTFAGGNFTERIISPSCRIDLKRWVLKHDDDDNFDFIVSTSALYGNTEIARADEIYNVLYEDSLSAVAKCFK